MEVEVATGVGLVPTADALHHLWIVAVPVGWEVWVVKRHATKETTSGPTSRKTDHDLLA